MLVAVAISTSNLFGDVGYLLAIGSAIAYFYNNRTNQSKSDLIATVVTQSARLAEDKEEISALKTADQVKTAKISSLENAVATLERTKSGVDVMLVGFRELGVKPELLAAAANGKSDL